MIIFKQMLLKYVNILFSIKLTEKIFKLANTGYTTVFHANNESHLRYVPLVDKIVNVNNDTLIMDQPMPQDAAMIVYILPSIKQ